MAIDFLKFDKQIDREQLKNDIADVKKNGVSTNREVPAGTYMCDLEKLELGTTKDGRPMVKGMFRIIGNEDGDKCDFTKWCLFYNRTIFGTKNDASMIAGAITFLTELEPSDSVGDIVFEDYSQFAELIMDIAEDVSGEVRYIIDYEPDDFNSISISDTIEVG